MNLLFKTFRHKSLKGTVFTEVCETCDGQVRPYKMSCQVNENTCDNKKEKP